MEGQEPAADGSGPGGAGVEDSAGWRGRVLGAVLDVSLISGGIVVGVVCVATALSDPATLVEPVFLLMVAAYVAFFPLRFVRDLPYRGRALGLELTLLWAAFAATRVVGPAPGPTVLLSFVVVSSTLFLGSAALVSSLLATAGVMAFALYASTPTPEPAVAIVRGTVVFASVSGALGLLVYYVVGQIEVALRSTQDALVRLRAAALERRKAREALEATRHELEQARRLEAIGRLAGGIAHDFNNTLQVILGWADLLAATQQEAPHALRAGEAIRDAAQRARALTKELLTFSRQHVPELTAVNLADLVEGMAPSIRRLLPEDIEIEIEIDEAPSIRGEEALLSSAILNLVVNARDAMPTGGTLTVRVREASAEDVPAGGAEGPDSWALLEVADTGMGMDEETRARIFEPFFSTKEEAGTGLGLATVWGVVAQCGGQLSVESAPGAGSTFCALLPRTHGEQRRGADSEPEASAGPGEGTVLVAEDEDAVRDIIVRVLDGAGYRVVAAQDADEAIDLARRQESVDLVCTDGVMPGRPTHELITEIRRLHPRSRILLCTGYLEEDLLRRQLDAGTLSYLAKPFTMSELLDRVQALMGGRAG